MLGVFCATLCVRRPPERRFAAISASSCSRCPKSSAHGVVLTPPGLGSRSEMSRDRGASERSIMNQTGHRSVQMVRRYIRDGSLFRENNAGKLGL